jgi:hypothetical protein
MTYEEVNSMAMEITDDTFYMVQLPEGKTLYQTEEDAISHLEQRAEGIDPESKDVSVIRISVDEGDWTIAEMSWQNIALQLMGE